MILEQQGGRESAFCWVGTCTYGQAWFFPPCVEASVIEPTRKVRFPITFLTTKYSRGILSPINEVEIDIWLHRNTMTVINCTGGSTLWSWTRYPIPRYSLNLASTFYSSYNHRGLSFSAHITPRSDQKYHRTCLWHHHRLYRIVFGQGMVLPPDPISCNRGAALAGHTPTIPERLYGWERHNHLTNTVLQIAESIHPITLS